ncbi:MAG: BON domain-containing protein [Thermoguttaceae bacterium]
MKTARSLVLTICVTAAVSPLVGQPPSRDTTPRFTPFRGTSYGMFGQERYGEIESPLAPNSSFTKAFRFSADGFFRGYDINSDDTAIFRDVPPPEPVEALTREDVRAKKRPEPSVNRPLDAPSGGSQQQTVSRPPSLLEQEYRRLNAEQQRFRDGEPSVPTFGQPERAAQQRWMRDLGRPQPTTSPSIAGTSQPATTPSTVPPQQPVSPAANVFVGNAQVVGGMITPPQMPAIPAPTPRAANAQTGRGLERELETRLVTSPDVSLMSPVQVRLAGSTATLRGVVATEEQRAAASRVVLSHPAVQSVNNLMTVVPLDPSQIPPEQ